MFDTIVDTPLLAGQTIPAGTVTTYNDDSNIYVHYSATAPWLLGEVHVAVADSLAGIPQTKRGNPIPGRFAYSASFAPGITEYIVAIPRVAALAAAHQIVVATHAVVHAPENEGVEVRPANVYSFVPMRCIVGAEACHPGFSSST